MPARNALVSELLNAAHHRCNHAPDLSGGQGIVICAGGPVMITNAYVLVRVLREELGCRLPIEVWHMGGKEMPSFLADTFRNLECVVRDAFADTVGENAYHPQDGWQLKTHALIHTNFERVLMLDADQVPIRDPAEIFSWPQFLAEGAVFWPDVINLDKENPIWPLIGLPPANMVSWESGQLCIDKKRHMLALLVADQINRCAELFYRYIYGDKESFLLGWLLTGSSHALISHQPFQSDRMLYQRDMHGAPLFQHRTNAKFSLQSNNHFPDDFRHAECCREYLSDLGKTWNGHIFHPPLRSSSARETEAMVVRQRVYTLTVGNNENHTVEFLTGHQIGAGRSHELQNWYVSEADGNIDLVVRDKMKPVMRLGLTENRKWLGQRFAQPTGQVSLHPVEDSVAAHADDFTYLQKLIKVAGDNDELLFGTLLLMAKIEPTLPDEVARYAAAIASEKPGTAIQLFKMVDSLSGGLSGNPDKALSIRTNLPKFELPHYNRP